MLEVRSAGAHRGARQGGQAECVRDVARGLAGGQAFAQVGAAQAAQGGMGEALGGVRVAERAGVLGGLGEHGLDDLQQLGARTDALRSPKSRRRAGNR